ncbi:AMP-binding protein, partial [Caballeronia sp. dw_276]|uniref:AMP-binding protein n=1 Tax=Caballeronia sp. dw_276 TaxID=2719795 RepID=UPI001BD48A80
TIERMAQHFVRLLQGVAADASVRVGALPMLSAAEREQTVGKWNDTAVVYAREQTLHGLFEQQVQRDPDAVALVHESTRLTYGELNARANRLAHRLRALGVGPDVLVGLCVERSPEMMVALLGVLKAGGAYVPLDPSYPRERLTYMLADAKPAVVITQASPDPQLDTGDAAVFSFGRDDAGLEQEPDTNPAPFTLAQ